MRSTTRVLWGLALTTLVTAPLLATVSASATRSNNVSWRGTHTLPLTDGGAQSLSWSGRGRFAIHYSAECETTADWVSIQIIVDGQVLAPTAGFDDAFCSDHNNNNAYDGWTTAHYSVATSNLPLGVHTVQIQGSVRCFNEAACSQLSANFGDTSLVVTQ
jgi:hypothetical protein